MEDKVYLSKSKYCKAVQCNKILWMDKYKTEVAVQTARDTVLENGTKVGELARNLFGNYINVEYNKDLNVMVEETKNLLKDKPNIITEASFNYDNNFCSVDILKNDIDINLKYLEQVIFEINKKPPKINSKTKTPKIK